MKLQAFNGGKSLRLAPHLIGVNEGLVYSNIDNTEATLKPVKKRALDKLVEDKYAHYFIAKDEWISSSINRDYVEFQEKLYWTEDNSIPQEYNGTDTYNLGIKNPINKLGAGVLATPPGILNGTYTYCYTYYDSVTGIESSVSFLSDEVSPAFNQVVLSDLIPSTDARVTHKRIYRVGGSLTDFTLVNTISNTLLSYTDNLGDTAVQGNILESSTWLQAKYGAKYLTEVYAMLFYAVGDKLYFSEIGRPYAWPEEYFIDFPLDITGIGSVSNGLLVFTALRTYIVTGNTPATLSRYTLSEQYGCKSHKTIKQLGRTLIWLFNDGFYASAGGVPKNISRAVLGNLDLDPVVATVFKDVYYLQHTTGSIAYDVQYGAIYKDLNLGNTYLVSGNDKLYGYFSDDYYELFAGEDTETFNYLSPVLLDGSYTNRKNYKTFYVRSEGQIDISIYISGKKVFTWNLTDPDTHDLDIPQEYKDGYSVQFEISGTGTVYEIRYEPFGSTR